MNQVLMSLFYGPENLGSAKQSNLSRIIVSKWLRQALNSDQPGSKSLSMAYQADADTHFAHRGAT